MLIIRADGNAKIGAGHLMRCLTIAEAVRDCAGWKKDEILFVCADEDSAGMVEAHGFAAGVLHTDYRFMETELEQGETAKAPVPSKGFIGWERYVRGTGHILLVDSYYVTDVYLEQLKRFGRVFLMDDLQDHAYPVENVINYNLFADEAVYRRIYAGSPTKFYLGGRYVPLREQFQRVDYQVKDVVRNVLITTGGGDADGIAGEILDKIYAPDIIFHMLVGRFNPHFDRYLERAKHSSNIRIHQDVQDMAALMCGCDMAVSAGGSTIYELAAVGVPFICFSYAPNQEALTDCVGRWSIGENTGAWHRDREKCLCGIQGSFGRLCGDEMLRRQYAEKARQLIDTRGAARLAEVLTDSARSKG